jgi:hypothetical protein
VRAAAEELWANYARCLSATPACDTSNFADYYTGVSLTNRTAEIAEYNAEGLGFTNLEENRIRIVSVAFFHENSTAVVRVCAQDHSVQVQPGAGPDGSDVVVDDDRGSAIVDWEMVRGEDGRWRQTFGDTIELSVNAEPVCDISG